MKNLMKFILKRVDLSKSYWSMYEEFLLKWDEDNDLENELKEVSVEEIEEIFKEIYKRYYQPDEQVFEKETTFGEYKGMTKHNFVYALNKKGEILLFNLTIGIMMSKTAFQKMLKLYSLDDITRPRLYCMFHHAHTRYDDNFVKDLLEAGVKWKPIQIKNPKRMLYRYPKISA